MSNKFFLSAAALALLLVADAAAQNRTIVQKIDYPEHYQTVTAISVIPPGGTAPRHTHPGIETTYVLEGEGNLSVEGQPDKLVKAGDSFSIGEALPHTVHNPSSDKPFKVLVTYIVAKDKPLATPAPK